MENISCTEPVGVAWSRMKSVLFAPFNAGKWFTLGFSAWLAQLGERGTSMNFDWIGDADKRGPLGEILRAHFALIIGIASILFLVLFAIGIALMWVRSRGKFMFLDNLLYNRAEIREPWHRFHRQGNSLFVWTLLFGIIVGLLAIALIAIGAALAWPDIRARDFGRSAIMALTIVGPLLVCLIGAAVFIQLFLESFVVPLMYRYGLSATEAWRRFGTLLRQRFWTFILYGLFIMVLTLGMACAILVFGCVTCCCGFLLLAIPYIGAVLLLPVSAFFRFYSVEYLKQFGSVWDIESSPFPPPME